MHFCANDKVKPFEQQVLDAHGIAETRLAQVAVDPAREARAVAQGWAGRFDRLVVYQDADVLDFLHFPLSKNTRRNWGLRLKQLLAALERFVSSPSWTALTISEINPDHGQAHPF